MKDVVKWAGISLGVAGVVLIPMWVFSVLIHIAVPQSLYTSGVLGVIGARWGLYVLIEADALFGDGWWKENL